jgi:hypothetical protein
MAVFAAIVVFTTIVIVVFADVAVVVPNLVPVSDAADVLVVSLIVNVDVLSFISKKTAINAVSPTDTVYIHLIVIFH